MRLLLLNDVFCWPYLLHIGHRDWERGHCTDQRINYTMMSAGWPCLQHLSQAKVTIQIKCTVTSLDLYTMMSPASLTGRGHHTNQMHDDISWPLHNDVCSISHRPRSPYKSNARWHLLIFTQWCLQHLSQAKVTIQIKCMVTSLDLYTMMSATSLTGQGHHTNQMHDDISWSLHNDVCSISHRPRSPYKSNARWHLLIFTQWCLQHLSQAKVTIQIKCTVTSLDLYTMMSAAPLTGQGHHTHQMHGDISWSLHNDVCNISHRPRSPYKSNAWWHLLIFTQWCLQHLSQAEVTIHIKYTMTSLDLYTMMSVASLTGQGNHTNQMHDDISWPLHNDVCSISHRPRKPYKSNARWHLLTFTQWCL